MEVGGEEAVAAAAAAAAGAAAAAARSESTVTSMPPLPADRRSPEKEEVEKMEEVSGEKSEQEQALPSPRGVGGFVAREIGRLEAEARLGLGGDLSESELEEITLKDDGLALGDLESVYDDPMSVRDQTPPLSLGRSALEQAPAAAAAAETAPEKSSGFSLRNAFSMFLGKKGSGSGTYSDHADRRDDSAAGSSCGETMGEAQNAFYIDGVPEVLSADRKPVVGEMEGGGGEEVTVCSPLGSSLDRLPGLVLPTPDDGESLF